MRLIVAAETTSDCYRPTRVNSESVAVRDTASALPCDLVALRTSDSTEEQPQSFVGGMMGTQSVAQYSFRSGKPLDHTHASHSHCSCAIDV